MQNTTPVKNDYDILEEQQTLSPKPTSLQTIMRFAATFHVVDMPNGHHVHLMLN